MINSLFKSGSNAALFRRKSDENNLFRTEKSFTIFEGREETESGSSSDDDDSYTTSSSHTSNANESGHEHAGTFVAIKPKPLIQPVINPRVANKICSSVRTRSKRCNYLPAFLCEKKPFYEFVNITICYINIVNYTKWCVHQSPTHVVTIIKLYSDYVDRLLADYKTLYKVKLSTNNLVVVGGLNPEDNRSTSLSECLQFCKDILQNLDHIQRLFSNRSIGVRIGVHVSNATGVVLNNVLNSECFELFGNDVNFSHDLSYNALKNTLHLSYKTVCMLHNDSLHTKSNHLLPPIYIDFVRDNVVEKTYDTIGSQMSFTFHLKKKECLIFFELKTLMQRFVHNSSTFLTNYKYIVGDLPNMFSLMYGFFWEFVVFFFNTNEIPPILVKQLIGFRKWEKNRYPQNILLVCNTTNLDANNDVYDIATVLSTQNNENIYTDIMRIINTNYTILDFDNKMYYNIE